MKDRHVKKVIDTIDGLWSDVEGMLMSGKLSPRYRTFVDYYHRLTTICRNELLNIPKASTPLPLEYMEQFSKSYLDQLLQLHYYIMKKSDKYNTKTEKLERALENLAEDALIKLKSYDIQTFIISQKNDIDSHSRLLPFSFEIRDNWKCGIIIVKEKLLKDPLMWGIVGHELGHLIEQEKGKKSDQLELWADLVATILFGSSYISATLDFSSDLPFFQKWDKHPPWYFRIETMMYYNDAFIKNSNHPVKREKGIAKNIMKRYDALKNDKKNDEKPLSPNIILDLDSQRALAMKKMDNYLSINDISSFIFIDKIIVEGLLKELDNLSPIEIIKLYNYEIGLNKNKISKTKVINRIEKWGS